MSLKLVALMTHVHTEPLPAKRRGRWRMLILTWMVYACFGITGGSLPPLVGAVTSDLVLSSTQMGLVLGAWQLIYIGTASPLGAVVDRFGVRRSMAVGLAVVWISLLLRAAAVGRSSQVDGFRPQDVC